MRRMRSAASGLWLVALLTLGLGSTQAQAGPHEIVGKSLVYLELKYTPTVEGPTFGVPMTSQATGFLVSDDGFILTSYHLIEDMVTSQGTDHMTLQAYLHGPGSSFKYDCAIVNSLKPLDLLLLKIRPDPDKEYVSAELGRTEQIGDQTLFTSGFHGTERFSLQGDVSNRVGPLGVGYLWAVNIPVSAGQSGSPVYLADGTVVGVLKGNSKTAEAIGYMIPIEYADALIAHLRMSAIEQRLTKVESDMRNVGSYYSWSGEMKGGALVISYTKLIAGEPQINRIIYSIIPFVTFKDGEKAGQTIKDTPMPKDTAPVVVDQDGKGGQIIIPDIDELLKNKISVTEDAARIPALNVVVIPIVGEDKKLLPKTIPVDVVQPQ